MNTKELELLLSEKARIIEDLQNELEKTNQGIILLTLELAELEQAKLRDGMETIRQLQDELSETNQGLLALTVELNESEEKYRSILENAAEAIFTFSEDGWTETINPAASQLFGYQENELIGMNIGTLIPEFALMAGINSISQHLKQITVNGETFVQGLKKNGSLFPVEFTLAIVRTVFKNRGNLKFRGKCSYQPLYMTKI